MWLGSMILWRRLRDSWSETEIQGVGEGCLDGDCSAIGDEMARYIERIVYLCNVEGDWAR